MLSPKKLFATNYFWVIVSIVWKSRFSEQFQRDGIRYEDRLVQCSHCREPCFREPPSFLLFFFFMFFLFSSSSSLFLHLVLRFRLDLLLDLLRSNIKKWLLIVTHLLKNFTASLWCYLPRNILSWKDLPPLNIDSFFASSAIRMVTPIEL